MAVDTAPRRLSMLDFSNAGFWLMAPDAAIDVGDRNHLLGLYSGIFGQVILVIGSTVIKTRMNTGGIDRQEIEDTP